MTTYTVRNSFGDCFVCGEHQDLRFGCCVDCADQVKVSRQDDGSYRIVLANGGQYVATVPAGHESLR